MRQPLPAALLSICLLLTFAAGAAAQTPHHAPHHAPPAADADALLRIMLEGPHLVLAHDGFIVLTGQQVRRLRLGRSEVCAAEVGYARQKAAARTELARLVAGAADTAALRPVLERLARLDVERTLTLARARAQTLSELGPAQRRQLAWLGDHWTRETNAMIAAATHPAQRGHPGMQLPIRVPGMVVMETALAPFCEALHGPAVHISIPPPG
jgi:hypothetical protein